MGIILAYPTGDVWDFDEKDEPYKVREGAMLHRRIRPLSRFMNGDIPHQCANPDCNAEFNGVAWEGKRTGKLYCTRHCRDEMSDDVASIEDAARSVN